jgi:UDP-2,3-diacylglucosamine hydrolase
MRTIFLADAHLVSPDEQNYRLLLRFLRELEGQTETLFIMGDLFDFWLGFPSNPFRQFDDVLAALQSLVRSGCRLVYFEGNHDFHVGNIFRRQLGALVHTGPAVVTVQGCRLFLCHGDQINARDYGYRLLRLLLHSRLTAGLVRIAPPSLALCIRSRLQSTSRAGYGANLQRWDYRAIIRSFARSIRGLGCDGLVTGHFHLAFCEKIDDPPFTILSLGDWMKQFTYGEITAGALSLQTYHVPTEAP